MAYQDSCYNYIIFNLPPVSDTIINKLIKVTVIFLPMFSNLLVKNSLFFRFALNRKVFRQLL